MLGNVAVHQPGTRVVRAEGNDDGPAAGQEDDVAPGRVVEVEGEELLRERGVGVVELEDGKVVAVEMDLVGTLVRIAKRAVGDGKSYRVGAGLAIVRDVKVHLQFARQPPNKTSGLRCEDSIPSPPR